MEQLQLIASSWVEDVEEEEGYCPAGNVNDDSSWALVQQQLGTSGSRTGALRGEETTVDRELSRRSLGRDAFFSLPSPLFLSSLPPRPPRPFLLVLVLLVLLVLLFLFVLALSSLLLL